MLNRGKLYLGDGTAFSYGNQSPELDTVRLAWAVGDVRLYVGGTDDTIVRYQCSVAGTPGTWVTVSAGGGGGGTVIDDSALTATSLYTSPTWATGSYGQVDFELWVAGPTTVGQSSMTLDGVSGSGTYNDSSTPLGGSNNNQNQWKLIDGLGAPFDDYVQGSLYIKQGFSTNLKTIVNINAPAYITLWRNGNNTDVSGSPTGIIIAFPVNVDGWIKIVGYP